MSAPDPIRIVPVDSVAAVGAVAHGAVAPAMPEMIYRGGPLLGSVEAVTVFWGDAWTQQPLADLAASLDRFFDVVVTSALIDQLAEYGVEGSPIGHGTHLASATIAAAPPRSLTDAAIQDAVRGWIADSTVPPPGPNVLYLVYLPPNVTVSMGGSRSCLAFCGYHGDLDGTTFYAVLPYPGCAGCTGGRGPLDALTVTSSHELAEAITDPIPGEGWYDDANGEIGDVCAWQTTPLGDYTVQLEWSNEARGCV